MRTHEPAPDASAGGARQATAQPSGPSWIRASGSLLLTGIGEVWAAVREGGRRKSTGSGLVLMVGSAAAFALMAAFVKSFLPDTPTQAVVLSRGVLMTAAFVALALWRGVALRGQRTGLLLLRGLLGYAALSCYFFSVQHLPLGDAVLLQYSHPIFVAAIAPAVLGETTRRGHGWLVALALVGVALIVHPQGSLRIPAVVGVLGSMLSGAAYVSVRQLSRSEHPLTILVWFPLVSIPPSLVATLAAGRAALPRDGGEVAGHLLVFLSAVAGQIMLTLGLSRVAAAQATAVTLSGPVFGLLLGLAFFGDVPSAGSLVGAAIVLTSLAVLGWRR